MTNSLDHFLRFLAVGTWGFIVNTVVLIFGVRMGFSPSISGPVGAEFAIISNFLLNNYWTFSDRKITSFDVMAPKFLAFNLLSLGSVAIQFVFLKTGEKLIGEADYKMPFIDIPKVANISFVKMLLQIPLVFKLAKKITSYLIFYVAGVAVGLVVNFLVYNFIIWK